jgi:branched-chain amino acid transport system substrate-binding protein
VEGDSTGVTADEIRIGVHAPLTGAAPIPQRSVAVAVRQYWDHMGDVHGRRVEVFLRDDRYNPSHATQVCNELIQRQQVFILNGVGGADQIAACARTAAQQGVPYFSSGTVHGVLENVRSYFAFSMSYKQQAPLVVQEIQQHARPSNNRVAILRDRTPSFNEAVAEVARLLEQAGFEVLQRQHQNGPSDAQWLVANQIETAFPIMAPSAWVQIVNSPGGSIDHWVGMGPTMGLNSVASAACPAIDGARFFSPWSGLNVADELDPEWARAGRGDDIQWAAWTGYRGIHEVLNLMGADGLTRENFVHVLENNVISTGVGPDQRHSRDNHFGVNQAHLLVANCSAREFQTPPDGLFRSP